LQESYLTKRETEQIAEWRLRYPKTSYLTMLGWVEGGRYEPLPEWMERRLAGVAVETTLGQEAFLEAWKRRNP